MKKMMAIVVMVVGMVLMMGCQSSSVTQQDMQSLASAAGSGIAMLYNAEGSMLTPQQKKVAQEVIVVFGQIGSSVNAGNINDLPAVVNAAIAKNIKDPTELAMAQNCASVMLKVVNPYLQKQSTQDAVLIFAAFCRGMASAAK